MSRLIKANTYIPVSSEPFDMPLPLKFELLCMNTLLCVYTVAEDGTVDFAYNSNTDIPILTPIDRRLNINDIYYLFRSRVFPENPYTVTQDLERLGLTDYNPYSIAVQTHGILPTNAYWLRFAGEKLSYSEAWQLYTELMYTVPRPTTLEGIDRFLE